MSGSVAGPVAAVVAAPGVAANRGTCAQGWAPPLLKSKVKQVKETLPEAAETVGSGVGWQWLAVVSGLWYFL